MGVKNWRKYIVIIISVLVIIFICWEVIFLFYGMIYEVKFSHESYDQAKRFFLIEVYVPPKSHDICYWTRPYRKFGQISANFKISENDFIDWAERKGWQLQNIKDLRGYAPSRGYIIWGLSVKHEVNPDDYINIKSGYFFEKGKSDKDGFVIKVAYDKDINKGFFALFID